jgi:hypothetical protein
MDKNAEFVKYQAHKGQEEYLRAEAAKFLRRAAIEEQLADMALKNMLELES